MAPNPLVLEPSTGLPLFVSANGVIKTSKRRRPADHTAQELRTEAVIPPGRSIKSARVVPPPVLPTGLVYDPSHTRHKHPLRRHPERPERVEAIIDHLKGLGLVEACTRVPTVDADDDDLTSVHNKFYIRRLRGLAGAPVDRLVEEAEQFDSVYLNEGTVDCAKKAAGGLVQLVKDVVEGRLKNGLALIRPPGHHAEAHHARGFCVINNVAVAATYARKKLGVSRVMICDWDIHHGNGTQRSFLHDPSVLYVSCHRYDHGRFFPGGPDGSPQQVGVGEGAGYTINIGWNGPGAGDAEYLHAWRRVVMPAARAFDPELVLVSAGFDGAEGDDLGGCRLTPKGFGRLTRELLSLASGRVVLALEGGYKLSILPRCVEECLRPMLPLPPGHGEEGGLPPSPEHEEEEEGEVMLAAMEAVEETVRHHRHYLLAPDRQPPQQA